MAYLVTKAVMFEFITYEEYDRSLEDTNHLRRITHVLYDGEYIEAFKVIDLVPTEDEAISLCEKEKINALQLISG